MPMKLPKIAGFDEQAMQKYFKNTGLLLFGRVGSLAIKMAINITVANYLLPDKKGILDSSAAFVYLFAALATLGLDSFVVKELHQYPQQRNKILGTAFGLKSIAGLILIPFLYVFWQFYSLSGVPYLFIFILSFLGIIQSVTVVDSYFQAQIKSKYIMHVQIVANLVSVAIKLTLIFAKASLLGFVYAYVIDFLLISLGYLLVYNRSGRSAWQWRFNSVLAKKLLSLSWPLIVSGLMVSIYMRIDTIMLKEILGGEKGNEASGSYSTVVMFSEALNFVPGAIVASLFPAILNAKRDDTARYKKRTQNLYDLMIWLSLAFAAGISIFSPIIYKLFKPEYASAAPVLSVHVWGSIFVFLGVASGQILIAEGFNKILFIRTGLGAAVNIGLNLLLIPTMGMMGTAIATVVAYAIATFSVLLLPKTSKQGIMMLKSLFLVSAIQKLKKS